MLENDTVKVPTYIALSPLYKLDARHRNKMYRGLAKWSQQLPPSFQEKPGRMISRVVLDGYARRLLPELWMVNMAISILPTTAEFNVLMNTRFAEAMGDVEEWVLAIGERLGPIRDQLQSHRNQLRRRQIRQGQQY